MRFKAILIGLAAALAASPAAAIDVQPAPKQASGAEQLKALIEQMRAEILRPGPLVAGWREGGADPEAQLRSLGADTHYFLISEGTKQEVGIVTDRRIAEFVPADWRMLDSYGSPVAYAENPSLHFTPFGSRYVVAMRNDGWREGTADCSKKVTHAVLFEDPDRPAGKDDAGTAVGLFRIALLALDGQTICAKAEGDAKQGWRMRHFLPDGHALPALDDDRPLVTIVPAAPLETLVKPGPEA